MNKKLSLVAFSVSLVSPLSALAQGVPGATGINPDYVSGYANNIIDIINTLVVPALMAIAFLVFLWGVYKYFILGAADEGSREEGRKFTMWGIIGFVVIVSLWGLVYLVMSTLGLSVGVTAPPSPKYTPTTGAGGGAGYGADCFTASGEFVC